MNILLIVLILLTIICMGYYLFAASYAGVASSFLWFWLLAAFGLICLIILTLLHKKYHILDVIPKAVKIIIISVFCLGCVVFLTMEGLIISKMNSKAEGDVDYIIVLGAQVRGERVTKSLAKRLDVAYEYLVLHEDTMVVCTGGKGSGEDITEALAMKRYLIEKGIAEERIILEEKSTSTYENLKFALEIIGDKHAKVAIATNNFHVYRAVHLGEYVGFENVQGIAGASDNRLLPNYMVREGLALFKELLVH
ncbi:MAG: YdcF family protein [Lachnospiraceae bacterium]|nr:YdcF family protein [Lachnospiraceae bacterium]